MAALPWKKFQDFYLRLGFLKVLVGVLSPQRRSVLNESIVRRLVSPLFDPAPGHPELWSRVRADISWYPRKTARGKSIEYPETAEALLVAGRTGSLLYGVTRDTAYKILDWGHDMELVGRGNQITERGLMLRHLLPSDGLESFLSGDTLAWNPFVLSLKERVFFLYHLVEFDRVTVEIIDALSELEPGSLLESGDAARMTCRALFRALAETEHFVEPRDIPTYRTAQELAHTIAEELGLTDLPNGVAGANRRRAPKPVKPAARKSAFLGGSTGAKSRRTTKNADHQTIPRFEQLVDLEFLRKVPDRSLDGEAAVLAGRRRWRYATMDSCRAWAAARHTTASRRQPFQWHGFAGAAVAAFQNRTRVQQLDVATLASYLWAAYEKVHRPMGHTPFDSVALHAMIAAAGDGIGIELADFHELMLTIKKRSALPEHAFFASGNDLDKMFIQLKPGFVEQARLCVDLEIRASES